MRKLLIAAAAVAATAAVPTTAGAAAQPPGTCDLIKNTICQYVPPTSVDDVCAIVDHTTTLSCTINREVVA